jgi:hypothetical protein
MRVQHSKAELDVCAKSQIPRVAGGTGSRTGVIGRLLRTTPVAAAHPFAETGPAYELVSDSLWRQELKAVKAGICEMEAKSNRLPR